MKTYLYDKSFRVHTEELDETEYHYIVKSMEFYDGYDSAWLSLEFDYMWADTKRINRNELDNSDDYDEQVICYIMVESIKEALEENGYIIDDEYLG